jgi:XTP/dITP diphosphohydrolase
VSIFNTAPSPETSFRRLLDIMDDLRAKCPWDKKQTLLSLRNLTIEETYELADALLDGNMQDIKEEIGDIMLHLIFYSKIASETNDFDVTDALNAVCEKLIQRHPHIYGDVIADTEAAVKRNWEQLKLQGGKKSVLQGVPTSLPAMVKAYRMQEKAQQVGFDWDNAADCYAKVTEELAELQATIDDNESLARREEEFGDLLFSLINYARFIDIDPETALERTNRKFKTRFEYIEANAHKPLTEMTLAEMDALWNAAKAQRG